MKAAYDEIADWYENEFLGAPPVDPDEPAGDNLGIFAALEELVGHGDGLCLEVGCGTGFYASWLRRRGWSPIGLDLSAGMLAYARPRLPVARADARQLPVASASLRIVIGVMVHTDMDDYAAVVRDAARVLEPGGVYVHVGVHPCFCGGFADRSDPDAVIIRPGYVDGHWTKASYTDRGVRVRVGATHVPLPALLHTFLDAGLVLERFREGGEPAPAVFAIRARKPT